MTEKRLRNQHAGERIRLAKCLSFHEITPLKSVPVPRHMKPQNVVLGCLCYMLLLLCSIFVTACLWQNFANGVLYHCSDPGLDLWPPFVHSVPGDTYLIPKPVVLTIWGAFVLLAFAVPAFIVWSVWKVADEDASDVEPSVGRVVR